MAEIKIPGGNPFSWKEFNNDCKTYHEAKERLKKIGVNTEQDAIVYLQREVDYYRDKIRHMEERKSGSLPYALTVSSVPVIITALSMLAAKPQR